MKQIDIDLVKEEQSRETLMVKAYGEVILWQEAMNMLHLTKVGLKRLIDRGVLKDACEGKRIDVRSIARYIEKPEEKKPRWRV